MVAGYDTIMNIIFRAAIQGLIGTITLFGVYFGIVTLISGWEFTADQFASFWYFIVSLAAGFGIQVGLYSYLRGIALHANTSKKALAVSGATSTVAMISCCAHYLANILPILAASGILAMIGQYQVELFWIGLAFNIAGIAYITRRIIKFKQSFSS